MGLMEEVKNYNQSYGSNFNQTNEIIGTRVSATVTH